MCKEKKLRTSNNLNIKRRDFFKCDSLILMQDSQISIPTNKDRYLPGNFKKESKIDIRLDFGIKIRISFIDLILVSDAISYIKSRFFFDD